MNIGPAKNPTKKAPVRSRISKKPPRFPAKSKKLKTDLSYDKVVGSLTKFIAIQKDESTKHTKNHF